MSSARTRRFLRFVPAILFAITAAACVTTESVPSASVTTIDPAATRWFQLEWTTTPVVGSDTQNVDVRVFNTYGEAARVQLLAQALDASGQLLDQKIAYPVDPIGGTTAPSSASARSPRRTSIACRCGTRTSSRPRRSSGNATVADSERSVGDASTSRARGDRAGRVWDSCVYTQNVEIVRANRARGARVLSRAGMQVAPPTRDTSARGTHA